MKDVQVLSIGGVNLDKDPRSLLPNELSGALDSDLLGSEEGQQTSCFPLPSSLEIFEIESVVAQFQYVRAKFLATSDSYIFVIKDTSGNILASPTIVVNPAWTVTDFVAALDTALTASGLSASFDTEDGEWFSLAIFQGAGTPIGYVLTQYEVIGATTTLLVTYTLQDWFNPLSASQGQFKPLQQHQVGNKLFTFSRTVDGAGYGIGYAVKDDNGDWAYTSLVISRNFNFTETKVIEIQSEEVSNGNYGIYWTDFNGKPKVIYIPTDMSSPLKYTMSEYVVPIGTFTLESIAQQTDLQIQNFGRINYNNQLESGGSLDAGTWFYYVQSGIGRNYSEWSASSEPISVFSTNTSSPSAGSLVGGDKTPKVTSKVNELIITGVDAKVYDTVRVAALLNQGGVYSAIIVGEYDTPETGEFIITHSGKESSIEDYDRNMLPPVSEVIELVENMQIKKNRMNLANIQNQVDEDLSAVFQTATLGQVKAELDSVGYVEFGSENIFRVSVTVPYSGSSAGEQPIQMQNDSTAPNFDTSNVYDLPNLVYIVPVGGAGEYTVNYSFSMQYAIDSGGAFNGANKIYIVNETTGIEYALLNIDPRNFPLSSSFVTGTQNVTLAAGDRLSMKMFVLNEIGGSSPYTVRAGTSFWVTKTVSNYNTKKIKVGEYQLPENMSTKVGHMVNEKYSYFGRVEYNTGFKGQWHPMGKYTFDNGNMFPAAVEDGWLTDATATETTKVYSYGLTVNGLDIRTIKSQIKRIEIGRAVCNPTILGTGIFIASNGSTGGAGGTFNSGLYTGNTDVATYGSVNNSTSDNRYFGVMICPDWATGDIKPQFQAGDSIIVYGCPNPYASQVIAGGNTKWGSYKEFFGSYVPDTGVAVTIEIEDAEYCEWNTNSRVLRNDIANKFLAAALSNDGTLPTMAAEGMAMALGVRINPITSMFASPDYGCYYVQYYRPNANQYNDVDDTIVSTNTFIDITPSTPDVLPEITVFGGDTYTQKTYAKVLYNALNPDTAKAGTLSSFLGFYSQNKINQQMRYVDKDFNNQPFPFGNSLDNYMFGLYEAGEQFQIDRGYTWENPVDYGKAYNPKIPAQSVFKSRIIYSQQKVLNALQDAYRIFLPNDYKDLAAKDGAIHALFDANDVMIAIQEGRISVLPYQSDVMVSGAEVYIGNGGVYAQRENPISAYGALLKSATMMARNESGNNNVYWVSNNGKGLFRYGNDGIKNLSNENGYRTYFLKNYNLCNQEFDIVLGFDQSRSDIFITARGYNNTIAAWNSATAYTTGQKVTYNASNKNQTFEQLTDIYMALGNSTNSNPYDNPADWQYQPITDTEYYNYSTVIFNEKYNFFRGNFSLIVSRYFSFDGVIIVPIGKAAYNKVFDLFGGSSILRWLDNGVSFKQGSFELEFVANKNGVIPKRWLSVGVQVGEAHLESNNPSAVITTETQTSDSVGLTEWEYTNGQIGMGVLSDHSDNVLISSYVKVKLVSQLYYRVYAVAVQFYVKFRTILR